MAFTLLVVLVAALCVQYSQAELSKCTVGTEFDCDPSTPDYVIIYGVRTECPPNSVCNSAKLGKVPTTGDITCKPCLSYEDICSSYDGKNTYKCDGDTKFKFSDQTFTCPKYSECVPPKTDALECSPCKFTKCDRESWTCEGQYVYLNGIKGVCPIGQKCNVEYKSPCSPCIEDNTGSVIFPINTAVNVYATSGFMVPALVTSILKWFW